MSKSRKCEKPRRARTETRSTPNKGKIAPGFNSKRSKYTCVSKPVHSSSSDYFDQNIGEKCSDRNDGIHPLDDFNHRKESCVNNYLLMHNFRDRFISRAQSHIGVFPSSQDNKDEDKDELSYIPAPIKQLLNKKAKVVPTKKPEVKIVKQQEKNEEEISGISKTSNKIITAYKDSDDNVSGKVFQEIFHNKGAFNSEEMLDKANLTDNLCKLVKMTEKATSSISPSGSNSSKSVVPIESDVDTTKCLYSSQSVSLVDISGQVSLGQLNSCKNVGVSSSTFQSIVDKPSIKNLQFKFKPLQDKYDNLKKSPVMRLPQIDSIVRGNSNIQEDDYQKWLRKHKFLDAADSKQIQLKDAHQEPTVSTSSCRLDKNDANLSNCSDLTSVSQRNEIIRIQFKSSFEESLLVEQNVLWNGVKYLYDIYSSEDIVVEHVSITDKFKRFVIMATFIYFVIYFDNFLDDFDMQIF